MKTTIVLPMIGVAIAAVLTACGGGGGSAGGGGSGRMSLSVTDAPVDQASAVVVQFTGVAVKAENGQETVITFDAPRSIDLLALQGGNSAALLDDHLLPAGPYEWIRLLVNAQRNTLDSYITLNDGTQHSLFIPSGSQTGLKLVRGFTIPVNGSASFTIDFDLRKSVTAPPGQGDNFFLKPALRVVDNAQIGTIAGTVSTATLADASCPNQTDPGQNSNVVYVFAGAGVTPDDVDGTAPDPVTTAKAENNGSGAYTYRAAFLAPGDYTIAFTCQAERDDPETNDALVFLATRTVNVTANATVTSDF